MANGDVSWGSASGLEQAAGSIDQQALKLQRIISDLHASVNLVDSNMFGDNKAAKEFFVKWSQDVGNWDKGVRSVATSIRLTGESVLAMARAIRITDHDTGEMAGNFGKYINGGPPHMAGGPGGGPNAPGIPPLTPPVGSGGGTGSSGTGGSGHGRH